MSVDSIIFWNALDPTKAALVTVDDLKSSTAQGQISPPEVISSVVLRMPASRRKAANRQLFDDIERMTSEWGSSIRAIGLHHVAFLSDLQDTTPRWAGYVSHDTSD